MKAKVFWRIFSFRNCGWFFVEQVNGDTVDSAENFRRKKKKNSVLKLRFIAITIPRIKIDILSTRSFAFSLAFF